MFKVERKQEKKRIMFTIIIGACVGIVATVLGGVWFIVNKALGVSCFSHRIDEVDKRTTNAVCDLHNKDINAMNGAEFLDEHKDFFFSLIDEYKPKTALDVENAAHAVCVASTDNDMFNGLKNFVYNSPSYIVTDVNGQERPYDLSLPDVCFILSLPLRDMYLEAHPEILTE